MPLLEKIVGCYLKRKNLLIAEQYYRSIINLLNSETKKQNYYIVLYTLCLIINYKNNVVDFNFIDDEFNQSHPLIEKILLVDLTSNDSLRFLRECNINDFTAMNFLIFLLNS